MNRHHGRPLPTYARQRESWPYIPSFPASSSMHGNAMVTARVVQVIRMDEFKLDSISTRISLPLQMRIHVLSGIELTQSIQQRS